MGSVVGGLFGGEPETSSSSSQQISAPEYLEDDLRFISDEARRIYNEGETTYYDGQRIADLSPQQQQSIDLRSQRALAGSPVTDNAQNFASDLISGAYQDNPYLDDYIAKLGQDALTAVNSSFNASGRLGSGANTDTAVTAITEAQLPFLLDQYNTSINQRLQGAGLANSLANQDYTDLNQLASAGQTQRSFEQQLLDEDFREYNFNENADLVNLQNYANLIYGSPGNRHTTTFGDATQSVDDGSSGLSDAVGLGLSVASFFCDERLKENITYAGVKNGMPVYEFNYIWSPVRWIAPIAQEVAKIVPEAVSKHITGFLVVDFDKLGFEMEKA